MTGVVNSNKMTNALVVKVYSVQLHPKYKKRFKTSKKYHVACSDSSKYEIGQTVEIQSTRPLSKTIRWRVVEDKNN
ncbi:mitochondrial small ribosomal subunit protein uS17m [Candidatus Gracilibacteria bacterium]|nr:mitochondrial small ribosomal subunit protein uS17m [Candidatus Gracilibacteria bacterium]NJS41563.1 mitochondrial small ribosomal subunit protein uS17m [Candidatus Gracilibacteria bacterium]